MEKGRVDPIRGREIVVARTDPCRVADPEAGRAALFVVPVCDVVAAALAAVRAGGEQIKIVVVLSG